MTRYVVVIAIIFFLEFVGQATAGCRSPASYIGGTIGFPALSSPAFVSKLLKDSDLGEYQHAIAMSKIGQHQADLDEEIWHSAGVDGPSWCVSEIGESNAGAAEAALFSKRRYCPQANMNASITDGTFVSPHDSAKPGQSYPYFMTDADLTALQIAMRKAAHFGAKNIGLVIAPNSLKEDYDDRYAVSGYYKNYREAARFGGGVALDVPPRLFLAFPLKYRDMVIQMIRFHVASGQRVSLILSPNTADEGANGYEKTFAFDVRTMISILGNAHALPTQYVVENYGERGSPNAFDSSENGLPAVAAWLAKAPKAPHGLAVPMFEGGASEASLYQSCR